MEWTRDGFTVTTDRARLDRDVIVRFLASSYRAERIPRATVDKSIENSLCFGLLQGDRQIGFARVVTDCATFALKRPEIFMERHDPDVYRRGALQNR
jgi:hypothetical protein